ncbi:UDP-N-ACETYLGLUCOSAMINE--peptide N-ACETYLGLUCOSAMINYLtransferase, partial [Aureobasidium melanogenum]
MDVAMSPRPRPPNTSTFDYPYAHHQKYHDDYFSSGSQTTRFAQPLRSPYGGSTSRPMSSENTLRRKTPNGTLNGAYESSNHGTQPAKHMVIHRQDSMHPYCQAPQMAHMDSIVNQQAVLPPRYINPMPHPFYGQSVPSVMQPSFQYLGPTASGIDGHGLYGPYWNDGTYVPYRPAAVRDPRFYSQHDGHYPMHGFVHPWNAPGPGLSYPASTHTWSAHDSGVPVVYPSFAGVHNVPYTPDFVPNFGPAPANARQREQAFNWALQTYRELLVYIQQLRKTSRQYKPPYQTSSPGPRFYPKPPRLSGASPPTNAYSSMSSHSTQINVSALYSNGYPYGTASHTTSSSTPLPSPGAIVQPLHDTSPPARAANALVLITRLCGETSWQWTDGIHLAGCIAYGLDRYQKAEDFYLKVLSLEPRHIEAMSNLAATLVALERKKEAEEYWMKVVKFAPNYFEAVEHLVGLLCSTSRGKEAIKVIDFIERSLRISRAHEPHKTTDHQSEMSSNASRSPCTSEHSDPAIYDFELDGDLSREPSSPKEPGFGSSGYAIPGADNGRMLALVHAKGNMLYTLGDNNGAAKAFEDAVLIATGRMFSGVAQLVKHILSVISAANASNAGPTDPVLLYPEQAANTARLCFPNYGELAGLRNVPASPSSPAQSAAVAIASNSLLSLAKIFQDGMGRNVQGAGGKPMVSGVREILALYYLSLSLQPSPSTANNVGILLAGVQQSVQPATTFHGSQDIPGVQPGSGIALALAYYHHGLMLDSRHAHLYTNLGSLLKDIGQLDAAVQMYRRAIQCDGKFDIALANLANAVKDKGKIAEAIEYYRRAVDVNPEFAEAVCGLANALNSVCSWQARGGIAADGGKRDRWHVDQNGMLLSAALSKPSTSGWINRVVDIVVRQLEEGESWGRGVLTTDIIDSMVQQISTFDCGTHELGQGLRQKIASWAGQKWEGARLVKLVERLTRRIGWHWYQDKYVRKTTRTGYRRPQLPANLNVPNAPTVLPFHTFTCPVSAKQVRLISERNGYRISALTLRMPWLPNDVYPPPAPPSPQLKVGYISSDFNNHPLAHLMQSVFGLHDRQRVEAFCYATTASDNSPYRRKIEEESPNFYNASNWTTERLVNQIVSDGIHILVNLNGYTRGARNEVFAARPAPIQMSFMGFAGTLGAEWCDYLLADDTAVPPSTLRPWRRNLDVEDRLIHEAESEEGDWVYAENLVYCRDTFFCCDHRQSAPDSEERRLTWEEEQSRRWTMRKEIFPALADDVIIFGNFNQLYKIEPTTFRTWLRILSQVPNSILWLLRFPDVGEMYLKRTAEAWAGPAVAARIIFTDVAPKHLHISRARVCDLFLDTPECNAHTTAADCLWSGTPLLTLPRYEYKMCSRMAASILKGALPKTPVDVREAAEKDLIASSDTEYEEMAIRLGKGLVYPRSGPDVGKGTGRLVELRKILTESRWTSALFDTARWTRDLEDAYSEAWRRWVNGEGGDIWLKDVPCGRVQEV